MINSLSENPKMADLEISSSRWSIRIINSDFLRRQTVHLTNSFRTLEEALETTCEILTKDKVRRIKVTCEWATNNRRQARVNSK